jgi:hypothetical protein
MNLEFALCVDCDMNQHNLFDNTEGVRIIIDYWISGNISYALILHPNNVLHLQWVVINK